MKIKRGRRLLAAVLSGTMLMATGIVASAMYVSDYRMVGSVGVTAEIGYNDYVAYAQTTASSNVDSDFELSVTTLAGTTPWDGTSYERPYYQMEKRYSTPVKRVWGAIRVDSPDGSYEFQLDTGD